MFAELSSSTLTDIEENIGAVNVDVPHPHEEGEEEPMVTEEDFTEKCKGCLLLEKNLCDWIKIWHKSRCAFWEIIYVPQILQKLWLLTLRRFTHFSLSSRFLVHYCMYLNEAWQECCTTSLDVLEGRYSFSTEFAGVIPLSLNRNLYLILNKPVAGAYVLQTCFV